MKTLFQFCLALLLFGALSISNAIASDDYPLRAKYPDVTPISTEDLAKSFSDTIVVDVRSTMEFNVAHVNNAKHIILAKATFVKELEKIRAKDGATPIAFYCNGHTCAKSYKATVKAAESGFKNIYAYDSGIFDWITAHPEKATLMGDTPAPAAKIIPKSNLKEKMLNFSDFKAKSASKNAVAIDIRDPFQRKVVPDVKNLRNIPLDRFLGLLKGKKLMDKELLILDAVGKQVRWLQYHLEKNGYTNYSFLEKGVGGIK